MTHASSGTASLSTRPRQDAPGSHAPILAIAGIVPGKPRQVAGQSFTDWIADLADWYLASETSMEQDRR